MPIPILVFNEVTLIFHFRCKCLCLTRPVLELLLVQELLEFSRWFVTETKKELHKSAWWFVVMEMSKEERLQ